MTITYTAPIACASTTTNLTYNNIEGTGSLVVYASPVVTLVGTGMMYTTVPNGTYTVSISTNCSTSLTTITVDGISTTVSSPTVFYTTVTFDGSHTIDCISTCVH